MKKIGIIIAVMVLFVSCQKQQQVMQSKNYPILTIQTSNETVKQSYSASIQGKQDISIYPQISGIIKKVCVKEGEKVRQGQVLFVIDQTAYKAALNVALSTEKTAKANVSTMLLEYNSKQELYKNKVVSEYDLKKAENNLLSAKASLSETQANVVNARNNLSYTTITSPSNGVIGTINYRQGALVSSSINNPLTIVSNNSETYVYFSISENNLLSMQREYGTISNIIKNFPKVSLQLSDGVNYNEQGVIESISGVVDKTTGSISIRARFENKDGLLHSGMSGNIIIPIEYKDCIKIPQSATKEIQDKIFVYKVINNKTQSCEVKVAQNNDGNNYIVTQGLKAGDKIVKTGAGFLSDGVVVSNNNNKLKK